MSLLTLNGGDEGVYYALILLYEALSQYEKYGHGQVVKFCFKIGI